MDILSYLLGRRAGGSGDSGGGGGGDTDDDIVIISIQPTGRLQQDLWACYRINLTKETTVELQPNEVDMLMMDMFNNSDDFGVYGGEVVACDYGYGKYPLVHVGQRNTSEIIITFFECDVQDSGQVGSADWITLQYSPTTSELRYLKSGSFAD